MKGYGELLKVLPDNVGMVPEVANFLEKGKETVSIEGLVTELTYDTDNTQEIIDTTNKMIGLTPIKTELYPTKSTGEIWKIYQKYVYPIFIPVAPEHRDKGKDKEEKEEEDDDKTEYDDIGCHESFVCGTYKPFKAQQTETEEKSKDNDDELWDGMRAYNISRYLLRYDDDIANVIADVYWELANELSTVAETKKYLAITVGFESMGGKIKVNDPENKTTSAHNRDAVATLICGVHWLNNESKGDALKYTKRFEDGCLKKISKVKYVNYLDNICGDSTLEQFYSNKELFEKAQVIKTKYDPNNRFNFEFSIPLKK